MSRHSHGHTGAIWGKSKMSPTYMAWNNSRSKYSKSTAPATWTGPGGFQRFLDEMGPKPPGARLAVDDERGGFYWRQGRVNRVESEQSAATFEVSGRSIPPIGDGPRI